MQVNWDYRLLNAGSDLYIYVNPFVKPTADNNNNAMPSKCIGKLEGRLGFGPLVKFTQGFSAQ